MLFFLVKFGYFSDLFYVFLLGRFVPAAKEYNNLPSVIFEIDAVTEAVINMQFGYISQETAVAGVSVCKTVNPCKNKSLANPVFQFFNPFGVDCRSANFLHVYSVEYNRQNAKRFAKKFLFSLCGAYGLGLFFRRPPPPGPQQFVEGVGGYTAS